MPNAATVTCSACGKRYNWKPELAGRKARCKCGQSIAMPLTAPGAEPPPPEVPAGPVGEDDILAIMGDAASQATARAAREDPANDISAPPPPQQPRAPRFRPATTYPTDRTAERSGYQMFSHQAAKMSWVAPVIAFVLTSCVASGFQDGKMPWLRVTLTGLSLLLVFAGLGLGIAALFGIQKYGRERILVPALCGTCVSFFILVTNIAVLARSGSDGSGGASAGEPGTLSGARAKRMNARQMEQAGRDVVEKYPGWLGAAGSEESGMVVVVECGDNAEFTKYVKDNFTQDFKLIILAIDNTKGKQDLVFQPESFTLFTSDRTTIKPYTMDQVASWAKQDAADIRTKWSGPQTAPARGRLNECMIFVPPDTNFAKVLGARFKINGAERELRGQWYMADEKAELVRRGR